MNLNHPYTIDDIEALCRLEKQLGLDKVSNKFHSTKQRVEILLEIYLKKAEHDAFSNEKPSSVVTQQIAHNVLAKYNLTHILNPMEMQNKPYYGYVCQTGCGHITLTDKHYKTKRTYCAICGEKTEMEYIGVYDIKLQKTIDLGL